jgi:hypothetical protein
MVFFWFETILIKLPPKAQNSDYVEIKFRRSSFNNGGVNISNISKSPVLNSNPDNLLFFSIAFLQQ